jgi:hypothetical protein
MVVTGSFDIQVNGYAGAETRRACRRSSSVT